MALMSLPLRVLVSAAVIAVFLPLGGTLIYVHFQSDVESHAEMEQLKFGNVLSETSLQLSRLPLEQETLSEMKYILSVAAASEGIKHLSLINVEGTVLVSSRNRWIGKPIHEMWQGFRIPKNNTRKSVILLADRLLAGAEWVELSQTKAGKIRSSQQLILVGEYSFRKVHGALVTKLMKETAFYIAMLLLSVLLISVLLVRLVSVPLERMSKYLSSFERLEEAKEVAVSGAAEMQSLGITINKMSLALKEYHNHLSQEIERHKSTADTLSQFKAALDSAADAMFIIDTEKMLFIDVNQAACASLGYSREELLMMGPHEIKPMMGRQVLQDVFHHVGEHQQVKTLETLHERKSGETFPVEVFLSRMAQHENIVVASVRDISERKEREAQLRKLSYAVQTMAEGVIVTDKDARIEYVNPAFIEMTGYQFYEVIDKKTSLLNSGKQSKAFYQNMWETISSGKNWQGMITDERKDGSLVPVMLSITPVFDNSKLITHYVAILQNMTQYKKMEEQFIRSQKMESIGVLVGGIAHDFNNMLAGIIGNAYLAKKMAPEHPKLGVKLEAIETLSRRASTMIKQLLAFARKDSVDMAHVELNEFLEEACKLAKTAIPENIQFSVQVCEEKISVNADVTQLQQMVMNLSNNARDAVATVAGPRVSCSLEKYSADANFRQKYPDMPHKHYALLRVEDNGAGIEAEYLEKVFDPFFTTKKVGEGTGLGLAMVYGCVKAHDGVIEVQSEPGQGTIFEVYLPVIEAVEKRVDEQTQMALGNGETILLVEDEAVIRETTSEVLKDLGYHVLEAGDGEKALAMFESGDEKIELVISDIVMPKMSGEEFVLAIREKGANTPVIFVTGYDREKITALKEPIENTELVSKPYQYNELSQLIYTMLHG